MKLDYLKDLVEELEIEESLETNGGCGSFTPCTGRCVTSWRPPGGGGGTGC